MIKICPQCAKEFESRTKYRHNLKFCCRSCASTYCNLHYPKERVKPFKRPKLPNNKRKKNNSSTYTDCACGGLKSKGYKLCRDCKTKQGIEQTGRMTIQDAKTTEGPSAYTYVRTHAHKIMRFYNIPKKCILCAYDKYVEVCHIRSISDFDKNITLSDVNDLSNLVHLCPNHHKELDRGLLSQTDMIIIANGSKHLTNK